MALCSHGSHALRNSRGAPIAIKSRRAGSLPNRLHCMVPHNAVGHLNSRNAGNSSGLKTVPVPIWNWMSRPPMIKLAVSPFGRGETDAELRSRNKAHWPVFAISEVVHPGLGDRSRARPRCDHLRPAIGSMSATGWPNWMTSQRRRRFRISRRSRPTMVGGVTARLKPGIFPPVEKNASLIWDARWNWRSVSGDIRRATGLS